MSATPSDIDAKLSNLVDRQEKTDRRVDDHDAVLKRLGEATEGLLTRMDRLERKATIAVILFLANGQVDVDHVFRLMGLS